MNKLINYGICDISDGLVKLGFKDGGYIPNLTLQSSINSVIIGSVYTVLYAAKDDPRPEVNHSYIDSLPKDKVLMIGLSPDLQMINAPFTKVANALYGGLMSTRAKYLQAKGSVIMGRIRDVQEHENLDYPVWSYGIGSTAPTPYLKVVGINVPLEVVLPSPKYGDHGNITKVIQPDDIVMGDRSGVVTFPLGVVDQLVDYVPKRVEADSNVASDIQKGTPAKEAQKYWRLRI